MAWILFLEQVPLVCQGSCLCGKAGDGLADAAGWDVNANCLDQGAPKKALDVEDVRWERHSGDGRT